MEIKAKFGNERAPRARCSSVSKFRKVCKSAKGRKFGKILLLQPLGVHSPVWVTIIKNKNNRPAQAVRDEAFLSPAATKTGFSMALRAQIGNAHGSHSVVASVRRSEVRKTAITHVRLCWDDHSDRSVKGWAFQRNIASSHECGVLQDLLISAPAVSEYEYSVCEVSMCSKARKGVQTVPRHIMLSRAGFPFSKPSPRRSSGLVGNHVHHLLLNREFDSCGNQNFCHFFPSGKRGNVST